MLRGVRWPRRAGDQHQQSSGAPAYTGVVDPGTSSLRFLVAELTGPQATVWGWDEGRGCGATDTQRLLVTCQEILARAEAMAGRRADHWSPADHLAVGLPPSQLLGRSWTVTQKRLQPARPVEERELEILLGRTLRLAINQLRRVAPSAKQSRDSEPGAPQPDDSEWVLVDAAIVDLTVDGHRVTDPVGFRAQEIGAAVFAALARRETIETWRIVAQQLEFSTLTLTASSLALAAALRDQHGVLLDVGGDATDLTLWQSGCPVALGSVPAGGDALTRLLAHTWDLSFEDAERLKCAYASGLLTEEDHTRVLEAMFPALREWLEETETALARLNQDRPLPQRLYLLGGGSVLPEMVEAARALAWSERIHFERYPQVARLRPTDIPGVVNRTDLGRGPGDVSALALAAWAGQQYQPPDRPARILSELCQRF